VADVVSKGAAATNALVRNLFDAFLPPDRRRTALGADFDLVTILALRGDAARGRTLFNGVSQCSRCHLCEGAGRAFGPDLTGIGKKYDRAQLLDQIVHPSKLIAPEYKTVTLTLANGQELTGFVVSRAADGWVLRDETLAD